MPAPPTGLSEIYRAVGESRADAAVAAAIASFMAGATVPEVVHRAALGAAFRYEGVVGHGLHGLLALADVAGALPFLDEPSQRLAALQAVRLAASAPKSAGPVPPYRVLSGEVSHLATSSLLALRGADSAEAESVFLGIVTEGRERRMAGEILFRAALEDRGDEGHKLLTAVGLWQLADAAGFRDGRSILRPAVQLLVKAPRDPRPHAVMMAVLGREWVDLSALSAATKRLDDAGRGKLATGAAAPGDEACVLAVLALLHEGYAPDAVATGIVAEAARRALASEGYGLDALHALLYACAARRVVGYTRSPERVYAVFQAALRVRSPAPHIPLSAASDPADEADGLRRVAVALDGHKPREASAAVRAYLGKGFPAVALVRVLGSHAIVDSTLANEGHNLAVLDACGQEYLATPNPEVLMACAKLLAASPRDASAAKAWAAELAR